MSTALFITGTDTGAGKTYVTACIARILKQQGRAVRVCKPVATGAVERDGDWISEDTLILARAAGQTPRQVTAYSYREPAAPPVAARAEGKSLTLGCIADAVRNCARPRATLLVEGVGGLLCPLTDTETIADLVGVLAVPLIVVARRSLGTLNHTLLTLEVARGRGLKVAGLVVTETQPGQPGAAEETVVAELRRRIDVPLLAVLPHRGPGEETPAELAAVPWAELAGNLAYSD